MPRGQEFSTNGHLYRGVESGLSSLCARLGERAVFVGVARAQATAALFQMPQLVAVTDLASAMAAIGEIIEQGEGARGDWRSAHYGRFLAMWEEYQDVRRQDPTFEPARAVLPAFTRQPFDVAAPQPVIHDPLTHQVAEVTGLAYEMVLHLLLRLFTHTDETDEQLTILANGAVRMMMGVLAPLARTLTTMPVGPEHPGLHAGFTFEMYYIMGNLVPWREPAWALLAERAAILEERAAAVAGIPGVPATVQQAGQRAAAIATTLATHVPGHLAPARPDGDAPNHA
jgi:hypothetical protein